MSRPSCRLLTVWGLSLALLTACGSSAPTQFYTLRAVPSATGLQLSSTLPLRIARVEVPATLDRPEIVRELPNNQVKVDDLSHWSAPLGQLMRTTLVEDLIRLLPNGKVVPTDAPKPAAVVDVSVEVVAIHEAATSLSLDATWTQTRPSGDAGTTTVQTQSFSAPLADRSNGAYADALSQAVAQLADAIARRLGGG
jgi:uncharacterized lipoprotein YmbA